MSLDMLNTLEEIEAWTLQQLGRGAADPRSALHWPLVCTAADRPSGRVMVLRKFDPTHRRLTLYTDRRTAKVEEIAANPNVEVIFFDQKKGLQIRASGTARCETATEAAATAFKAIPEKRRGDYATTFAPGTPIASPDDYQRDLAIADKHFCLIMVDITQIDWLHLDRSGHRRATLNWGGNEVERSWLIP